MNAKHLPAEAEHGEFRLDLQGLTLWAKLDRVYLLQTSQEQAHLPMHLQFFAALCIGMHHNVCQVSYSAPSTL